MIDTLLYSSIEKHPDKSALVDVDGNLNVSYRELGSLIAAYSAMFREQGLGYGSNVVLFMPNSITWIVSWYSLIVIGCRVTCIDFQFTNREIRELMEQTESHTIVSAASDQKSRLDTESPQDVPLNIIYIGESNPENISTTLPGIETLMGKKTSLVHGRCGDTILVSYRGTGYALPVIHDPSSLHASVLANNELTGIDESLVIPLLLPLTHVFALTCNLLSPLSVGGTIIITSSMRPASLLDMMDQYRCTFLLTVPSMLHIFTMQSRRWKGELSALKHGIVGGSIVDAETQQVFNNRFSCMLVEGYGLTESCPVLSNRFTSNNYGCLGSPMLSVSTRVIPVDGDPTRGVLHVKSPTLFKGYAGNRPLFEELVKDGWFDTGDIVNLNSDGTFTFEACNKMLVKTGGFSVDPLEAARILSGYHGVTDVDYTVTSDKLWGERVNFTIETDSQVDEDQLRAWLRERVAGYKMPRVIDFTH
jgi:long-chain acyl-CoA synthetase